jgi:hypothetical protein
VPLKGVSLLTVTAITSLVPLFFGSPVFAAPTVTVTAPSPASGTVAVTARTSSTKYQKSLQVYIDGTRVVSCGKVSSCTYQWDTTAVDNGAHVVRARRVSTSGSVIWSSPLTVHVENASEPPPPPPTGDIPALDLWEAQMVSGGTK